MEKLFGSLNVYEVVLLVLGVFLFILLCCALVYSIYKKEDIKRFLYFFLIPVLMIGYPSIREIQVSKDRFAVIMDQREVENNPNDERALKALEESTEKFKPRARTSEDLALVSKSYVLLEDPDEAILFADRAIRMESVGLSTDFSEDETTTETEAKENRIAQQLIDSLEGIKAIANIQKAIKTDSTILKDSLRLRARIQGIKTISPKTREYLNKKYVLKNLSTINNR